MRSSKHTAQQFGVFAVIILILYVVFKHADFGYNFYWAVLYEVNPTYKEIFGYWLLRGLQLTIEISLISTGIALVLGTIFGIARLSEFKPTYYLATGYVEFFRNTPLLVQLFFWYFAFPLALPETIRIFLNEHNFEFWAATIGLGVYTGSFVAEIVRAGIQAIPHGHVEAAHSSGLSGTQMLRFVILPQAFRVIIPPLGSEFLNNMKNSSLAMTIGVAELCWQSQQIESFTFRGFEATSAASLIYLGLSLSISVVMNSINHHLKIGQDKQLSALDKFLGLCFKPFYLMGRMLFLLIRWIKELFHMGEYAPPHEEAVYASIWSRLATFAWKWMVFFAKIIFVILFIAVVIAIIYAIYSFNWTVIWNNLPALLIWTFPHGGAGEIFFGLGGLTLSIIIAGIALFVSFFIGLVFGLGRLSNNPLISTPSIIYIEIIRGNPLIMVIFWVYFFSPIVTGMQIDVFWSATIAFTIFSGAYLAEIVRAGVSAIPFGQVEAATASGLSYFQIMRKVVLPQALKIMIPAIVGQFISLFKDTSLAYIIGVFELTTIAQTLNNRLMIYPFEIYTTIAVLYFICCYSMSMVAKRLEQKYSPA
ncbi:MAG TPA: amino acid ABC transporter permease [Deltaproteobacteria bacterium]|nr:amino acid ABC transporter permease [Deltaproteobacteria bacterium]HPJ93206.1 amino acid ABC transporter permease [Deltaproteobacteria bacterium]HPR50870.1 amino acid ABC transporter permease [Deltaproteobacteria bacterium]